MDEKLPDPLKESASGSPYAPSPASSGDPGVGRVSPVSPPPPAPSPPPAPVTPTVAEDTPLPPPKPRATSLNPPAPPPPVPSPSAPDAPPPPPPPAPPPPQVIPAGGPSAGGNRLERIRSLIRPLFIIGIILLLGFLAVSFLSFDLSRLPLVGSFFGLSERQVELSYWGLWEDADVVNPLIADFVKAYEAENPRVTLTINYEKRSFGSLEQYKETLLTRLRQGTGPDIFRLHSSWVGSFENELSPLPTSVLSEEDYAVRFYPAALSSAKVGTDIFAIPLEYDGLVLFYNQKFFKDGKASEKLKTWEDFRREAVRLTKWEENDAEKGNILQAGAAFGTASNVSHASDLLSLLLAQSGVDPLTELGTQAGADALTFYVNFAKKDRVWDATLPFSINAFANGQVAMVFGPSWRALDIANLNPKLKFGAVLPPQLPSAPKEGVQWATFWTEGVSKDSQETKIAWKLLEFLTREEQQRKFFSNAAQNRLFGEPYALRSLGTTLSDDAILGPLLAGAPAGVLGKMAAFSGNASYEDVFKQAIGDVLAGRKPAAALKTAQATIDQLEGRAPQPEQ
ncbi:MAG: hypothetical protein BMS9Abin34_413 [Patescibacteria group bacterium]|nr:MAG: hypothetical protein BMS9Abin34_413 [Patescibacteria group bacterium]